ncbi:hypothetical protein [Neobacillus niacini]|jgi:hypothetical protein|uniref:hypothetical protein n=1 Tax=Neobacillus niacini TaxID=86668 RepID=UPI001C8D1812|nr:hypothetical protein [Neobacillus niacini]MBY0144243.1 hypothetical protein [Neobacillus niacini]
MRYQRTFFMINDLVIEVKQPEITLKKVIVAKIKIENEEYRMLRKKFDEDLFHIEKKPDGWYITEKE